MMFSKIIRSIADWPGAILIARGVPRIVLKRTSHTIAQYVIFKLGPFTLDTEIRLDWRTTREQFKYNDADLTLRAINEEVLHFVLHKTISKAASWSWDNFGREMRMFLQE